MATSAARAGSRRRRRALAAVAAAIAVVSSGLYWLADAGIATVVFAAQPAGVAGLGNKTATFTAMSSSITFPQFPTQSAGYALGRITVASGYASQTRVSFTWLDPEDAQNPLNYCSQTNNATSCAGWIEFGFYYPIQQAACNTNDAGSSGSLTVATITDGSTTYCGMLDTTATGPLVGTGKVAGQVLVSKEVLGSVLTPGATEPTSTSCPTTAPASKTTLPWCTPSGYSSQNIFFVVATVVLPGYNIPYGGQESPASTLKFWFTNT